MNYYYTDPSGQKQGPVDEQQLQELAAQRIITPDSLLEMESGFKGQAGQISGLTFPETSLPEAAPSESTPTEQNPFTGPAPMEINPFTSPATSRPPSIALPQVKIPDGYKWLIVIAGGLLSVFVGVVFLRPFLKPIARGASSLIYYVDNFDNYRPLN